MKRIVLFLLSLVFITSCGRDLNTKTITINDDADTFILNNEALKYPMNLGQLEYREYKPQHNIEPLKQEEGRGIALYYRDRKEPIGVLIRHKENIATKDANDYSVVYIRVNKSNDLNLEVFDIDFNTTYQEVLDKFKIKPEKKLDELTIENKNMEVILEFKKDIINSIKVIEKEAL